MSTAISSHGGAGPLSLMSCVRESSPPQDLGSEYEVEKTVSTKKRFWNPRKWFKRKNNKVADDVAVPNDVDTQETLRSRSTSELSEPEEPPKRRSGVPMHPGLSVSHDSVFHSPHSGSELELEGAHSSSSLSTHHNVHSGDRLQTELIERLRLRRGRGDTSEDDEGLPRSPCNSPTVTEKTATKDHPTKSHSTCSEGSLISMGSSEMDEDSSGQQSHHSSKMSLQDKKSFEGDLELETVQSSSYPLNHSAAHHRVSVRPSRRHGAPRRRRGQQMSSTALPTTLEVNEESSIRSVTPEITIREAVTELYSNCVVSKPSRFLTVNQLKCSSLPPGLASPNCDANKLHRSRSNAGTKSQDEIGTLGEEEKPHDKKSDSFLGKLFPIRRSGKKKKHSKEDKIKEDKSKDEKEKEDVIDSSSGFGASSPINIERKPPLDAHPKPFPRSGAAARQRVLPNDIPASPELSPRHEEFLLPKSSPEKSNIPSPLHLELESRLQQRMASQSLSISPKSSPNSPKSPTISPVMEKHFIKHSKVEIHERKSTELTTETNKSKAVIAGLSQFQKKAMIHHSDEKDYKSLTEISRDEENSKPIVVKSHSFKVVKNPNQLDKNSEITSKECTNTEVMKSNSFESIKNVDVIAVEKQKKTEIVDVKVKSEKFVDSAITISGPSHKAIVSIGNTNNNVVDNNSITMKVSEDFKKEELVNGESKITEHQASVTKIQVKKEFTQVIKSSTAIPEFMNVQLHKVEKPSSNVVLSTAFTRGDEYKPRISSTIEASVDNFGKEVEKSHKTEVITASNTKLEYEKLKMHVESSEIPKILTENPKIHMENPKIHNENKKAPTEIHKVHMESTKTYVENTKVHTESSKLQIQDSKMLHENMKLQNENSKSVQVQDKMKAEFEKYKDDILNQKREGEPTKLDQGKLKLESEKQKREIEKQKQENEKQKRENERQKQESEKQKENERQKQENDKSKLEAIEKLRTENGKSKLQNELFRFSNAKSKVQSEKCKVQNGKPKTDSEKPSKIDFEQSKIENESCKVDRQEKLEKSISLIQKPKTEMKTECSVLEPIEKLKVEPERRKTETEKSGIEKSKSETEKLKPETEKSKSEIERSQPEVEKSKIENVRKFSKEDIEIIEKEDHDDKKHVTTALVTITTMTAPPKSFKKPDNLPLRKSFVPMNTEKLEKPVLKIKSSSLDMVEIKSEKDDKSSSKLDEKVELRPKTYSASDITDANQVTYRRKSIANQRKEDEPELMKVFARRSLKLKDNESEALSQQVVRMIEEEKEAAKSRDSDKENQNESPPEERKKKFDPEVTLRKPTVNNKITSSYQRAVSLNQKANEVNSEKVQKQYSLVERPKTEWIKTQDELITMTERGTFIEEDKPKNFNQRMAEWEKRAQSVRKTSP